MALSFIKSSGNIITEDFCLALAGETKADYVKDKSFGDSVKKIDEQIALAFEKLRERWEENRVQLMQNQADNATLRRKWILPLFEALGFEDLAYVSSNLNSSSGIEYHLPYKAWNSEYAPPIHMVHSSQEFDTKDKTSRTHPGRSPHDCLQQYLNTSNHQWAILTNGKKIRLLRDFYHSITKGFLEFDLEGIFETANSEQFRVLYRILHRSRFENQYQGTRETEYNEEGNPIEQEDSCLLEKFHKKSRETGVKIGNKLRDQVIEAIEKLGNGFAENLNPDEFQNGKVKAYYNEILNIIYRLLFLMFAEQKGWLPVRNTIYAHAYSLNALREMAERGNYAHDEERDLWEGLKITFKLVAKGFTFPNGDTINAFGGQLFSDRKIPTILALHLKNKHLLDAIYRLSYFKHENLANRINYANLAIDELGSVYESLLDYEPKLAPEETKRGSREIRRGEFYLDDRGTERKTTGSYYTDSRLVAQLIESALVPVIQNALKDEDTAAEKEKALLDLKVADIACGSGAFLCAALEKMGEQLALIRMGEEERPTDEQLRSAKRDILLNCIYGVDLNPMAVELAKFSLWITASLPDMPLTFLDHKLKCGNSLIGATPELIKKGIPEEAYKAVGNDIPEICTELKKKVRRQLEQMNKAQEPSAQYGLKFEKRDTDELLRLRQALNSKKQSGTDEVDKVEEEYRKLEKHERKFKDWLLADVWTSAFFIEKTKHDLEFYPTNSTLENLRENQSVDPDLIKKVMELSEQFHFFHFHLEFPEVFNKGGFDCILGNPPWEKLQLEDKNFGLKKERPFPISDSSGNLNPLSEILKSNAQLSNEYYLKSIYLLKVVAFIKNSFKFSLTSKGNINTYLVFSESYIHLINDTGYSSFITPSGIATDDTSKDYFRFIVDEKLLISLFDFENREKIFDIDSRIKFCILTLSKRINNNPINLMFYATNPEQLQNESKHYSLYNEDFTLINPNTRNCPSFRDNYQAVLVKKIYKNSSIIDYELKQKNEYGWHAWQMINDTHEKKLLLSFSQNADLYGVYEGKLFYQYDHRFSEFRSDDFIPNFNHDITYLTRKRYSIEKATIDKRIEKNNWKHAWQIVFRLVCRATDSRTFIATIVPRSATTVSAPSVVIKDSKNALLLLANLNCFSFDYVVRTKLGGTALNHFIVKQLPLIPLTSFSIKLIEVINQKVLMLTFNSIDLIELALDFNADPIPFSWDENERFILKCELDAIFSHLYKLNKHELDYVLESFLIIKRKDIEKYGSYRTKETILKLYDEFAWVREEMEKQETLNTK